jgi:hypothetical protein
VPTERDPIPGGVAADGGFTMTEPTALERSQLAARIVRALPELTALLDAADKLTQAYSHSADHGHGLEATRRMVSEAEAAYVEAKAATDAILYPSTLPEH